MIYTLTLNPSVDYIVELDNVEIGSLNRTKSESKFPGGKGINVSRVLKRMGVDSEAIGFAGGFTGRYITDSLQEENIRTRFVQVKDDTRINIKLKSGQETEINARGPEISKEDLGALTFEISRLGQGDMLVLAGSIPSTMPDNTYEAFAKMCHEAGAGFAADAEGELLKKVLPYRPFLIKPNHHELGELFGTEIHTCEEVLPYAKKLIEMGAQNVIISLAGEGAVFVNEDMAIAATVPKGILRSSVGAGDSMVAGFLAEFSRSGSYEAAFKYSVASGSATAFSIGLCTIEKVEELLPQVAVRII
ncbi:1-phosphofructokinase [Bacillus infantis]|uniref:1-phosphofructokinase n=1 Tax=Bacillus infantis TaxID=324767 RepID=UPI001CD5D75F|nr:1-phosphofructokinase [Bacillus infantis]MCA1035427.1 1-phosphofructokinase [Bacillus infantis]